MSTTRASSKAARYAVPVAVITVAVASVGLVPALADNGDPKLPKITAEELVAKVAESDVEQFSGTVKTRTSLGLPGENLQGLFQDFAGAAGAGASGADADLDPSARLAALFQGENTLKVAVDGEDRQRATLVSDAGDYTFVHNQGTVWAYDAAAKTAFRATAPDEDADAEADSDAKTPGGRGGIEKTNPQQAAKELLDALEDTTTVSVDGTTRLAGRDAYQLALKPKNAPDSTVDSVRIAVDAKNGMPLKVSLESRDGGKPIGEIGFTSVDFAKPAASTFDFAPPKGTKIVKPEDVDMEADGNGSAHGALPGLDAIPGLGDLPAIPGDTEGAEGAEGGKVIGEGWNSILMIKGDAEGAEGGLPEGGQAGDLVDAYTKKVKGDFGTGRLFSTRLVNTLITDDGTVYVGAVTKDGLIKAANANH
ncbi:DUF2092 domain-containing protein [Streptomyces durbertensis]|uniref:DUF2092 domain-containing protein n=1 Tax=Streptomyces durbertensis TaxID=2448886 RepID=A0ABR6ENP0_9ACTN|nr:sigma-E factor regulatory protein RseB domain-containing protein [Streptomyces durbertensis]MBB1246951.1 DUF2092 domain-containing protein [Streptomyces durbertensis]